MKVIDPWKSNIEDWNTVDKDTIDFALNEAKLCLQYSLDAADKLDQKAFILLASSFAIISGLLGFLSVQFKFDASLKEQNWNIFIPILTIIVAQIAACFRLIKTISPREFFAVGNEPRNFLTKEICVDNLFFIKASEAELYQGRIETCNEINSSKSKGITFAIKTIVWSFVISMIATFLLQIASYLYRFCPS